MSSFLGRLARAIYRHLVPARTKNSLRVQLLFDERDKPPLAIDSFEERRVLVLAPHMDDETIGCGGTLRRHIAAGAEVCVAFLTDGRRGDRELYRDPSVTAEQIETAEQALAELRVREARAAAAALGLGELVFLGETDGALTPHPALVARLVELIDRIRPEVVYVPALMDSHLDHWATSLALGECLPLASTAPQVIREYEVWSPLLVNRTVDIADVLEFKVRALEAYASQLPQLDLVRMSTGLAQYRSIYHGAGRGFSEAFHESSPDRYLALLARYRSRK